MLSGITQKHIDYVVVFKLSRFSRNAKDLLVSLSHLQKYGTNLICKENGLDSSTSMGCMMIAILSGVAEIERENILAQSMLGREEKAAQGGWNGRITPYGYVPHNGKLEIHEKDAKVIALISDKFVKEKWAIPPSLVISIRPAFPGASPRPPMADSLRIGMPGTSA